MPSIHSQSQEQGQAPAPEASAATRLVQFTIYGREVVQKRVTRSGQSGRIYLPAEWLGKTVTVIRQD
ncbi:MAG: DUF2080 family transposase-associated protein [Pseudomonadota bacterium]